MQKHWADQLAEKIKEEKGDKDTYNFNWGMSLSGRMHVGNLRELLTLLTVRKILEAEGKEVNNRGVFYTQDRFKGKDRQLGHFEDPGNAGKYIGWRLVDVPDPEGCHDNWPEHFNSENHPYFKKFGIQADPITTTEFYRMDETKKLVKKFLEERKKVREILNQFRERKPYPEGWIPFDPLCTNCNRIDETDALEIDFEEGKVKYKCEACGEEGWSDLEKGKLAWRLEWSALWEVLNVDFEPYGKDHATPGGSRDSCVALCEEFDLNYPAGFAYNWVYWKRDGEVKEMTSSGNVGLTAKEFTEIAEPEVLTYLYLSTKPMKEIYFNPDEIPTYFRRFDRAEAIYFGEEEARSEKREMNIKRNYELLMSEVPAEKPVRPSYKACSFVAQLADGDERAVELLRRMGEIQGNIDKKNKKIVLDRLDNARNWLERFSPEDYLIKIESDVSEVEGELSEEQKDVLRKLREELKDKSWTATDLQNRIYEMKDGYDISTGKLFQAIYLAILGKKSGPRAGQLIKAVGEKKVADILEDV